MRVFRKRPWSSLLVNMTPLIDVVFLMIIFFTVMINFSEIMVKKVTLPVADQARDSRTAVNGKVTLTVRSGDALFLGRRRIAFDELQDAIRPLTPDPRQATVCLRGDEEIPYDVVRRVMQQIAALGITRIEFATRKDIPVRTQGAPHP